MEMESTIGVKNRFTIICFLYYKLDIIINIPEEGVFVWMIIYQKPLKKYKMKAEDYIQQAEITTNKNITIEQDLARRDITLSEERVFIEFSKALTATKPSIFFQILKEANVLEVHFKEICDLC